MSNYFKDKVVLITGGSSGIGKELAIQLAKQNAKLILVSRSLSALQEVKDICLKFTQNCDVISFDLSQTHQIPALAIQALLLHSKIDVLINNAGVSQRSLTIETDLSVDKTIMNLDYFATIALTKALLPQFLENKNGHIVVISSVSGLMGFPMRSAYAAAKHALHGFFETLQTESKDVHITIACPGRINTPISLSALKGNGMPHQKMDQGQLNGISVQVCASKILKAVQNKKKRIIIAKEEKLLLLIKRYLPSLFFKIAHKKGMQAH